MQVKVISEPERNGVFLTRSCVQVTDISCGVVYKATLASLVLFQSYQYVGTTEKQEHGQVCHARCGGPRTASRTTDANLGSAFVKNAFL